MKQHKTRDELIQEAVNKMHVLGTVSYKLRVSRVSRTEFAKQCYAYLITIGASEAQCDYVYQAFLKYDEHKSNTETAQHDTRAFRPT